MTPDRRHAIAAVEPILSGFLPGRCACGEVDARRLVDEVVDALIAAGWNDGTEVKVQAANLNSDTPNSSEAERDRLAAEVERLRAERDEATQWRNVAHVALQGRPGPHTQTSTNGHGPDYCGECSEAIQDWVPWPCAAGKVERLDTLRDAYLGAAPCQTCDDTGNSSMGYSPGQTCPDCEGTGRRVPSMNEGRCQTCKGSGSVQRGRSQWSDPCPDCAPSKEEG